jgi:hypothetical protein
VNHQVTAVVRGWLMHTLLLLLLLLRLLLPRSCCRELELDAQLRALQTSELPTKLTAQQLQMLLQSAY